MIKKIRWQVAQFFEKFWWNNYLKNKNASEYLSWKKKYWISFLDQIQFELKSIGSKSLDVGSGPAGVFMLSKQIENTTWKAVDPLVKNYSNLEIFDSEKYPKVSFVNSTFEDYRDSEKFNSIFCINAINHFINLKDNLKKLNRLLDKDGVLVLSTDAHNYKTLKYILYTLPLDVLHPHQYTEAEYSKMIYEAGFKIINKKQMNKAFIFSYYVYTLKKLK